MKRATSIYHIYTKIFLTVSFLSYAILEEIIPLKKDKDGIFISL